MAAEYFSCVRILVFLCQCCLLLGTVGRPYALGQTPSGDVGYTYEISAAGSRVSAGVYDGEGRLVRALFQNQVRSAGRHAGRWDGKDEEGKAVGAGSYQVRVLSNQVRYEWEGVIGNTSSERTGEGKWRTIGFFDGLLALGSDLYWAGGYSEGNGAQLRSTQANPQTRQMLLPTAYPSASDQSTYQVCSDGVRVYWGGRDAYSPHWFVFATQVGSDAPVTFSAGQSLKMTHGRTYSATGVVNAANGAITGLAVQASGPYLFIARRARNELQVIDKTTGALVRILSVASPGGLATDGQNRLYVAAGSRVVRYEVNPDGSLGGGQLSITGLESAQALALSPEGGTLAVADGGSSQQVKGYSTTTGALAWTLGQPGGYTQTATVSPDRFLFKSRSGSLVGTFLAFQPDGRLWVGDGGNYRAQRFSPTRVYETSVQYLPRLYSTAVDASNPTRVFADRLEFQIDYGRPLAPGNGSWTLVRNYEGGLPDAQFLEGDNEYTPQQVTTLSNGRTYCLIRRAAPTYQLEVVELLPTGARPTGILTDLNETLRPDGSRWTIYLGTTQRWTRRGLSGFDASHNPLWGPEVTHTEVPLGPLDPRSESPVGSRTELTSTGLLVAFLGELDPQRYHLGVVQAGGTAFRWRGARSTPAGYTGPFPEDGAFDIGNGVQYGGNRALALERSIFWGYHGEFWKNGQTNKYTHVWDNGLLVGQFGAVREGATAAAGMAGNAFTPQVVKVGGDYYLYHGDESDHGGVHRWKITNLQSIQEQQIALQYPAVEAVLPEPGLDLMAGLPQGQVLINHTHGWSRRPTAENLTARYSNYWSVRTGVKSHTRPDVYAAFEQTNATAEVRRDLGLVSDSAWSLTGYLDLDDNEGNTAEGGCYLEVLDVNEYVIARLYQTIEYGAEARGTIRANDQLLVADRAGPLYQLVRQRQPFTIRLQHNQLAIAYGPYEAATVRPVDSRADVKAPRTVRLYFFAQSGPPRSRAMSVQEMRLLTEHSPAAPGGPLRVYPNPTQGTFWLGDLPSEEGVLMLFTLTGQHCATWNVGGGAAAGPFAADALPAGTYLLRYQTRSGVRTTRFVKQ
jgi:hypothetical protein